MINPSANCGLHSQKIDMNNYEYKILGIIQASFILENLYVDHN